MAAAVATVSVEEPEPVTDVGTNVPVAPVGNLLTVKLTAELNPFAPVTVGVKVVMTPQVTDCDLSVPASVDVGVTCVTRVTAGVYTILPLVPVTVKV